MAVLDILKYPHVQLRQECKPVERITDEIKGMCQDLVDTMYDGPGAVGLSAPQVGYPLRIVVIDVTAKTTRDELRVMINPEIVQQSRNKLVREGCLSFPEYLVNLKRATRVTCKYLTPDGEEVTWESQSQLEAIAIQHEIDHLDGVLMIDRVNSLKTDLIRRYASGQ
jgi:peptide deformylase